MNFEQKNLEIDLPDIIDSATDEYDELLARDADSLSFIQSVLLLNRDYYMTSNE